MKKWRQDGEGIDKKPIWKEKWFKLTCIVLSIVVVLSTLGGLFFKKGSSNKNEKMQMTYKVQRGDVKATITGSGTVEPYERFDITPLVSGTILSCNYEEGDYVEKDALLYEFEHEDMDISLTKTLNSIERAKINNKSNYEAQDKLKIYAPQSGVLRNFNIKSGDRVQNGTIAIVEDTKNMVARVPFSGAQIASMAIGQSATVYIEQYMVALPGTVTYISNASGQSGDGSVLYDVEISFENPGAISSGLRVAADVLTSSGTEESPYSGIIKEADSKNVKAEASGDVKEVYVKDGAWVNKGDLILELDGDDVYDTITKTNLDMSDLELSYKSQQKKLDDYYIKSPIAGTVITKNYKAGDNMAQSNQSSNILMTVADMSKMKFTFSADELDIDKVALGQAVDVTADAIEAERYEGVVTKIASEGTSQNGVTTYAVEVTINEPKSLRPGMNVNAEIIYDSRTDVLYVPASAVVTERGKSYVNIVTNRKEGEESAAPLETEKMEVEVGLSSENTVEIISGLKEGDEVVLNETGSGMSTMRGMMGGMMGGGMPGGMMGGGMPGGGGMQGRR